MQSKKNSKSKKASIDDHNQSLDIRNFIKSKHPSESDNNHNHNQHNQHDRNIETFDHDNIETFDQVPIKSVDDSIKENEFMEFFQVNQLVNSKYLQKNSLNNSQSIQRFPQMSSEQLIELALLFKLTGESEFIHQMRGCDHGRMLIKQIDLCLETLKCSYEMCPDKFKENFNYLVQNHQKSLQNNNL